MQANPMNREWTAPSPSRGAAEQARATPTSPSPAPAPTAAMAGHTRAESVEPVDFAALLQASAAGSRGRVWQRQAAMDMLRGNGGNNSFDVSASYLGRTKAISKPVDVATTAILAKRLLARHRSKKAMQEGGDSKGTPGVAGGEGEDGSGWDDEEGQYSSGESEDYSEEEEEELELESGDEFEDDDGGVWVYSAREDAWTLANEEDEEEEYELDSDYEGAEEYGLDFGQAHDVEAPPTATQSAGPAVRAPIPPDSKVVANPVAPQVHPRQPPPPPNVNMYVPAGTAEGHYLPPQYFMAYQQRAVMDLVSSSARAREQTMQAVRAQASKSRRAPGIPAFTRQGTLDTGASADVDVAHADAAKVHPRVDVQGVPRKFPVCGTPTGRHCFRYVDEWFCCAVCGDTTSVSYLAEFGPGISLYFKYIKWLAWVFGLLSLVHLPAMVLNAIGPGATLGTAVGDLGVHSLTLGNLGDARNVTEIFLPLTTCGDRQCSLSKEDVAVLYSVCGLLGTVLMLVAYMWLRFFEAREQPLVDEDYITVDDYAVAVRPLPATADDVSLRKHFEKVTGHHVVEVNVARDESKLVRLAEQRGANIRKLVEVEEELLEASATGNRKAFRALQGRKAKILSLISKVDKAIGSERERHIGVLAQVARSGSPALLKSKSGLKGRWRGRGRALGAFVVFDTEAGREKALQLYRGSNLWCLRICQSEKLRYRPALRIAQDGKKTDLGGSSEACACCWKTSSGRMPIRVVPAPDPSSIKWKNLGANAWNRGARRCCTTLFALFAIALSFGLLVWASYRQQQVRETGGEAVCPEDRRVTLQDVQGNDELLHCYCSGLGARDLVQDSNCRGWVRERSLATAVQAISSASVVAVNLALATIMKRLTQFEKHHSMDSQSMSLSIRLFFSQFINTALVTVFVNADWTLIGVPVAPISQQYDDFSSAWYATVGAGIVLTMLLNIISPHAFPLARWAQRRCMTRVALGEPFCYCPSVIMRLCCLCCCPRWCCDVVKEIPHSTVRSRQRHYCCARLCAPCMPKHQDKLTKLFTGPEFRLSVRYAQLTNTIFVCLTFAAGMPILLPIGCASFIVSFYVDKYLFLRFYRIPPHYDSRMGMTMSGLFPYAILLHVGCAAWMYSNKAIFSSAEYVLQQVQDGALSAGGALETATLTYSERLSQLHVIPFIVLFFGISIFLVAVNALEQVSSAAGRCLSIMTCGYCQAHADFMSQLAKNKTPLTFTQATAPGPNNTPPKMIGTASYNILMQPHCQEAFALSTAFVRDKKAFKNVADIVFDALPTEERLRAERQAIKAKVKEGRKQKQRDVTKQLRAQKRADKRDRAVAAKMAHTAALKKSKGRRR